MKAGTPAVRARRAVERRRRPRRTTAAAAVRSPDVRSRRASARAARPSRRAVADRTSEIALQASRTRARPGRPIRASVARGGAAARAGWPRWADGSRMAVGGRTSRPGPRIPGRRERITGPAGALGSLGGHEGRLPGRTGRLQRACGPLPVPRRRAVALRCGPLGLLPGHERGGRVRGRPARELAGGVGQRDLRPPVGDDLAPDRGGGGGPGGPRAARRARRAARGGPPRPVALAGARPVRGVPRLDADRADAGARHGGAARLVAELADPHEAAVASVDAAASNGLAVLAERIQTDKENFTKFAVIGTAPADLGPARQDLARDGRPRRAGLAAALARAVRHPRHQHAQARVPARGGAGPSNT